MTAPPPRRVVAVLLAGRGAFRGTVILSAPVLLALWGGQAFAPYAVVVGTTLVLNPLVGSGAEKSAGALLGREAAAGGTAGRGGLLGAHLAVGGGIAVGSLVAATTLLPWLSGSADLYLLAAATNVGFGAVQAVVGYWRVLGRPYLDTVGHGVLAAAVALGVALSAWAGAGPREVLAVQAVTALSTAAVLGVTLCRRAARPRRPELVLTARTTFLMGANTLLATAAVSVVFAMLAQRGLVAAASVLYLAVVAYTVLANLLDYLLRVFQPGLAASLAAGTTAILRTAERASRVGLAVVVPLSAGAVLGLDRVLDGAAEAAAAVGAVAPALLSVAALVWLLENVDTGTLVGTTLAGVLGLAATVAAGSALLSSFPVAGAALALLAGAAVTAAGLLPVLRRRVAGRTPKSLLVPTLGRHP